MVGKGASGCANEQLRQKQSLLKGKTSSGVCLVESLQISTIESYNYLISVK